MYCRKARSRRAIAPAAAAMLALAGHCAPALAIDTQPFDYATLAPGSNVLIGYYLYDDYDRFVDVQGRETRDGTRLQTNLGVLRVGHWMKLGGFTTVMNVLLPFGQYTQGRMGGAGMSGVHDTQVANLRFNTTVFLIDDDASNRRLGIGGYLDFPTGSYDKNRDLNLGDNRWSGTLQVGYLQGVTERLSVELVGDVTWRGDNDDATPAGLTLSQEQSHSAQAWLNYSWRAGKFASVGYSANFGGKVKLDGVANGSKTESRTLRAALGTSLAQDLFLMGQVDYPTSVRGGFQRDVGVVVRVVKLL